MPRGQLHGPLGEPLGRLGLIVERLKVGTERLQSLEVRGRAADGVGQAIDSNRAEEPDQVSLDRSAQRAIPLIDLLNRRCAAAAGARALGVVAVPRHRLQRCRSLAMEHVATARRDDVDVDAGAHRRGRVDAAGFHLDVAD